MTMLRENLRPGDNADKKRTVGANIPDIHPTTAKVPPELRMPAMRAVAARAHGAEDARDLLKHLGLIDPRTPKAQWRRAYKPKAES